MRDSPRSPMAKTNGSRFEGNRIINPHSRIPKSTNKQTNKRMKDLNSLTLRAECSRCALRFPMFEGWGVFSVVF